MKRAYTYKTGLGQDSHRFLPKDSKKPCIIAGIPIAGAPGICADSDGDPVFHALCNAITSLIHVPILGLGGIAPKLCQEGITDSKVYLEKGLELLFPEEIVHMAFSIEGKRPILEPFFPEMRNSLAEVVKIDREKIGFTATSGDRLTPFGKGEGLQCFCVLTTRRLSSF